MQSKSILLRAQKKIQHREDKLRHLAEETKRQTAEAEEMRAERERIRLEIGEMERREEDEDDEMGGLTMQIKQILAKVSEIWGDYCVRVVPIIHSLVFVVVHILRKHLSGPHWRMSRRCSRLLLRIVTRGRAS